MSDHDWPEPPVPADADLTMFNYMPLFIDRILQSRLFVKGDPEAFRAAFALMCVAWHRVPAGSLPDDDELLAGLAGIGTNKPSLRKWKRLRAEALQSWYKADDGNLYHPFLAEVALTSLELKRVKKKERLQANERQRRHSEKLRTAAGTNRELGAPGAEFEEGANEHADASATSTMTRQLTPQKGTSRDELKESNELNHGGQNGEVPFTQARIAQFPKAANYTPEFEKFFSVYPKAIGKMECFPVYLEAMADLGPQGAEILLDGVKQYRARVASTGTSLRYVKTPKNWLLGRCWEDRTSTPRAQDMPGGQFGMGG